MNAIILAAGLGSRFNSVTKNIHKALLPINDVPNIERTINYLREFGIKDINIVTGYMDHLFYSLKEKFNCNLIFNKYFRLYNNIYSFYSAIDYFNNTVVIDADVVLFDNIFVKKKESFYYTVLRPKSQDLEWIPKTDNNGRIIKIDITDEYEPSLLGMSYWNLSDCKIIKSALKKYLDKKILLNPKMYWDDIPRNLLKKMYVKTHVVESNLASEMDTIENYKNICKRICLKI